jgi:uncharacterized protein YukE
MIKNIHRILTSGDRIASSWARNIAEAIFGGVALTQFQNMLNKAHQAAAEVAAALQALQRARVLRNEALKELWDLIKQVKRGLLGDPDHGPNDPMVKEWGGKREEEYDSGLTRKSSSEETED